MNQQENTPSSPQSMRFQKHIQSIERLLKQFESIGYTGRGHIALCQCLRAFRVGDRDSALQAYQTLVAEGTSLTDACSDLSTDTATHEQLTYLGMAFIGLSIGMSLLEQGIE